jgi:hypothetical protein
MAHHHGHLASPAEIRSWERSLPVLAQDLVEAGLGTVEMLVEHRLPLTSQRVDVVLAGQHPRTGQPSYVVVELKQWTAVEAYEGNPDLVLVGGYGQNPKLHPAAQVSRYCEYLLDFTCALQDLRDPVSGVAYLHNAADGGVDDSRKRQPDPLGRLFTGQHRAAFLGHLRSRVDTGSDGASAADLLLNSAISPSRQLLALAADEVQRRESFVLIGDQQLAYESVPHAVHMARRANRKTAVIVSGGPGSGKSVVALSLPGELARQGRSVLHATGSRSFTRTLRQVAGRKSPRTKSLSKYFNQFMDAAPNDLEVLVLDEAHRIRETSADRWTRSQFRTGRPQVEELLSAARVPVFLLDQHQVVRPGEMGTVQEIERHARRLDMEVVTIELGEQFRCGGSKEYEHWVLRLLGLSEGGPIRWNGDANFEVRVADTPTEMESRLARLLEEGEGARMAAGYCWPWSDPRPDGSLVPDVVIDSWSHPWNLRGDRAVGGAPPAPLWATEPAGFAQVGCVYTAQGFEYDWNGVIIGPDLVWRKDRWVPVRSANKDPDFRSRTKVSDQEFDHLIRNVYKVLLTRGMKGTFLYSTDTETRTFLRSLIDRDGRSPSASHG